MHEIPELDRKGLRDFGIVTGVIFMVLFGIFFPWLLEIASPRWPWVLGGLLVAWGAAAPLTLAPVYRAWMRFGLLLSKVTTPIVLGIVFYLMILPTGIVMRILGRDPMSRKMDDTAPTYRTPSVKAQKKNMERPF